ncbi:MAG: SPOR domain-containing protein [Paracoccaceae bacterium]
MADIEFDAIEGTPGGGQPPGGPRAQRLLHLVGAVLSLALLVGAVWWGYQLAVRDVTGVPVMRALSGAMRVAPADPGGNVAGHQGLSVNAVAAAGTAAPLPETLNLAPAAEPLNAEDVAGLVQPVAPSLALAPQAGQLFPADAALPAQAPLAATEIPSSDQTAVAAAVAEALGAALTETAEAPQAAAPVLLTSALRPAPRPARAAPAAAAAATAVTEPTLTGAPAGASTTGVAPAAIAPGTSLVQLGAFDDDPTARSDWSRLTGRFPELMAGKSMVIQPAQSGGRTFYRLRALGFAGEDEARRFCTALLAEGASCVPVTQR